MAGGSDGIVLRGRDLNRADGGGNGRQQWLARAAKQFARTVYTELRRGGHAADDVVRFINEIMDLLSQDSGSHGVTTVKPPSLVDAEGGVPDRETIQEIFEFELRRSQNERRKERLVVLVFDVVLPGYIAYAVSSRAHEQLLIAIQASLRRSDALGKLGPDRYVIVAPNAKEGAMPALVGRLQGLLDRVAVELPPELSLAVRCVACDAHTKGLTDIVDRALAQPAQVLVPATAAPPRERLPHPVPPPRKIVLALGGGAARAASHAGVFSALKDAELTVVGIAGCSAGGLVGAMLLRGTSPAEVVDRFATFGSTSTYRDMRRAYAVFARAARADAARNRNRQLGGTSMAFYSHTALSAASNDLLHAMVEYFVGPDCAIESMRAPFAVVATDLIHGQSAVLAHGSLHAALAASCAVPGLFPPQAIGDRLLVDGSSVSELPVGAAQVLGVNAPILGVYLMRPDLAVAEFTSSADVATRANVVAHAELVREQLRHAKYLISVPVHDAGWLDFRHAERISAVGRDAARDALPRILERMDNAVNGDG